MEPINAPQRNIRRSVEGQQVDVTATLRVNLAEGLTARWSVTTRRTSEDIICLRMNQGDRNVLLGNPRGTL